MQTTLKGKSPRLLLLKSGSRKISKFTGKHLQCSSFFSVTWHAHLQLCQKKHSTVVAFKNFSLEDLRVTISVTDMDHSKQSYLTSSAWITNIYKLEGRTMQPYSYLTLSFFNSNEHNTQYKN